MNMIDESLPPQKWHDPLTQVTPLSKLVAMVVFVTLPFVGFLLGTLYAEPAVVAPPAVETPASTSTPAQETASTTAVVEVPIPTTGANDTTAAPVLYIPDGKTADKVHGGFPLTVGSTYGPWRFTEIEQGSKAGSAYFIFDGKVTLTGELYNNSEFGFLQFTPDAASRPLLPRYDDGSDRSYVFTQEDQDVVDIKPLLGRPMAEYEKVQVRVEVTKLVLPFRVPVSPLYPGLEVTSLRPVTATN